MPPNQPPITYEQLERAANQNLRTSSALEHAAEEHRLSRAQMREVLDVLLRGDKRREKSDAAWIALAGELAQWFPEVAARLAAAKEAAEAAGKESKEATAAAGRAEQATKEIKTHAETARLPPLIALVKILTSFVSDFMKAELKKMVAGIVLIILLMLAAGLATHYWISPWLKRAESLRPAVYSVDKNKELR